MNRFERELEWLEPELRRSARAAPYPRRRLSKRLAFALFALRVYTLAAVLVVAIVFVVSLVR